MLLFFTVGGLAWEPTPFCVGSSQDPESSSERKFCLTSVGFVCEGKGQTTKVVYIIQIHVRHSGAENGEMGNRVTCSLSRYLKSVSKVSNLLIGFHVMRYMILISRTIVPRDVLVTMRIGLSVCDFL